MKSKWIWLAAITIVFAFIGGLRYLLYYSITEALAFTLAMIVASIMVMAMVAPVFILLLLMFPYSSEIKK